MLGRGSATCGVLHGGVLVSPELDVSRGAGGNHRVHRSGADDRDERDGGEDGGDGAPRRLASASQQRSLLGAHFRPGVFSFGIKGEMRGVTRWFESELKKPAGKATLDGRSPDASSGTCGPCARLKRPTLWGILT